MKKYLSLLIIGAVLVGCENAQKQSGSSVLDLNEESVSEEYRISKEQAGYAKIDMTIEELNTFYNKTKIRQASYSLDGQSYQAYFIKTNSDSSALRIEPVCNKDCRIYRIKISDPSYKTKTGIGVGSTIADIKKYHLIDSIESTEEGPGVRVERLGLTFLLDPLTLPGNLVKETLPEEAKVSGIIISKSGLN
ncbi:MAG: hypothetical protein ACK40G_13270 [Cytophagaceae bacterium]